jgi:hypothetical protein
MKKPLDNEQGYALLSVIMIFVLLTVIATALMGKVIQSYQFVAIAESNSEEKITAQNAVEVASALLDQQIEDLNRTELSGATIVSDIENILRNLPNQTSENFSVDYEILKNGIETSGVVLFQVEISSPIGNSGEKFTKEFTISTVADVFKYAVVTPGNITFNGASYINGDVYADNVYSANQGKIGRGDFLWISLDSYPDTSYPTLEGSLTVRKNFYKRDYDWTLLFGYVAKNTKIDSLTQENINPYFYDIKPKLVDRPNLNVDRFDINNDYVYITKAKFLSENFFNREYSQKGNRNIRGNDSEPASTSYTNLTLKENSSLTINGHLMSKNNIKLEKNSTLKVLGDLYVHDDLIMNAGATIEVDGDIFINNSADVDTVELKCKEWWWFICVEYETVVDYNLTDKGNTPNTVLKGAIKLNPNANIYINGNFTIEDLELLNGVVYSNGSVTIHDHLSMGQNGTSIYTSGGADIKNLDNRNEGTLVLMTEGSIEVANNNLYNREPKVINAFLYTNSTLEIYGVGSNLEIHGGIYGENIILNAVKGNTTITDWNNIKLDSRDQDSIPYTESRLRIIYNEDLMLNPPDGIPSVQSVTLSEIDEYYE